MRDGYLTSAPRRTLSGLELRCPPLPQTLLEAMELIENPEKIDVRPVTEMVQRDPIVVARLLHIVNSAYYGLRHTISSAERAVVMLGPVAVAGIVAGMNMMKLNGMLEGPASQLLSRLIRHSLATAFLTRHLLDGPSRERAPMARRTNQRAGVSFTGGLLHDFGKIILVYNFPREAVEFYEGSSLALQVLEQDTRELERLVFGYDHTEAGEYVARKLNFPDLLTRAIRMHHEPAPPTGEGESDRLVRAVMAADLAANAMGYDIGRPLGKESLVLHPVWKTIAETDTRYPTDPADVLAELTEQQDHLDQYVQHMMAGASAPQRAVQSRVSSLRAAV